MAESWPRVHWVHRLVVAHIALGLVASALVALPSPEISVGVWIGVVLAQLTLASGRVWLGSASADKRTAGLIGAMLLFAMEGSVAAQGDVGTGIALICTFAGFIFFGAFVASIVHAFGLRIRPEDAASPDATDPSAMPPLQWTIRHWLVFTFFFACVLTLVNLAMPILLKSQAALGWALLAGFAVSVTLAFWAPLVSSRPLVWSAAALLLTALWSALFGYLADGAPEMFFTSLLATWIVIASLLVVRLAGYRAQRSPPTPVILKRIHQYQTRTPVASDSPGQSK